MEVSQMDLPIAGTAKPMRVMMLGLRGFPNVQGGIETHAEHLCPLLVKHGCDVTVITRSCYQPAENGSQWKGVKFVSLWAPKSKGLEAVLHSFIGVLYAAIKRPDVLHIQAIGPALMTPLARLLGLKVVVTHHGPDYDRQKWGKLAKFVLKTGEFLGMRFSNARIVISNVIADLVKTKHGVPVRTIPNGVVLPSLPVTTTALEKFGLTPRKYVLLVSRLVPEKRHHDLIQAFLKANLADWKLVLVGGSDHPDAYMRSVFEAAAEHENIVCTGFQTGLSLQELYTHAGFFVLPSSHEGLSIAKLEAMSYGLTVLASDIPANLELGLERDHYFKMGDVDDLCNHIKEVAQSENVMSNETVRSWLVEKYDWNKIAIKTLTEYKKLF